MIGERNPRQCQDDERRHKQQLVGHRVEPGAQAGALAGAPRDEAVQRVGQPGEAEDQKRGAEISVDDEQHERGNQGDAQDRQLVGQRQILHGGTRRAVVAASTRTRSITSTASAPETCRPT